MRPRIGIVHSAKLPVSGYGGTERVLWWLAKGLFERGYSVTLVSRPGTVCPYARVIPFDFLTSATELLSDVDVLHYWANPPEEPKMPYLVTIEGNGKIGEKFLANTVFVSKSHAERHRSSSYVYNGVDASEYVYSERKKEFLLFLAKASWHVKNVKGAIRLARRSQKPIHIVGGRRFFLPSWGQVYWEGFLGGDKKARLITEASSLLFPIQWKEPFGLAVIEALISGTPVVASRLGSMPELVPPHVGFLCSSENEFLEAIQNISGVNSKVCRDWATQNFSYQKMVERYLEIYARVLSGEVLNPTLPTATEPPEAIFPVL